MKYGLYSIRDSLNGYGTPLCDFNDSTAKRNFQSAFIAHKVATPGDYDLFRIGSFDVDTGCISPEANPVLIMRGIDTIPRNDESSEVVDDG